MDTTPFSCLNKNWNSYIHTTDVLYVVEYYSSISSGWDVDISQYKIYIET